MLRRFKEMDDGPRFLLIGGAFVAFCAIVIVYASIRERGHRVRTCAPDPWVDIGRAWTCQRSDGTLYRPIKK